ncbi:hypothetical protein GE09DRAFT_1223973 [Coniochaeta sp. 2T2.1]|nr:hypothetical protein GE09DRAFT_1223973 [Coniochaeta sp. 2T2.1]
MADFPTKACPTGIFVTHHFPACWDGKNLDSPDHQSHIYNTILTTGFVNGGPCPTTHPVHGNTFVWSFGASGSGTYADYMFSWKGDTLQKAMDKSEYFYNGYGSFKTQRVSEMPRMGAPM